MISTTPIVSLVKEQGENDSIMTRIYLNNPVTAIIDNISMDCLSVGISTEQDEDVYPEERLFTFWQDTDDTISVTFLFDNLPQSIQDKIASDVLSNNTLTTCPDK